MKPEAVADGKGARFAGIEEVETWREILDALKARGGGEAEEVNTAENCGGKVEEEDSGGGRLWWGWHVGREGRNYLGISG